jgi:hypothetical protein
MSNMLSNANKESAAFMCIRWEVRIIQFIINVFSPVKMKESTDVIGRTGSSTLGDTSNRFVECVVQDEAYVHEA